MRFGIVVAAAVLTAPALGLAQTPLRTSPSGTPAGQAALDRDCRAGNAAACAAAAGRRGQAGPARQGAGSDQPPQVRDATKDANPAPRYSGEGGGMPAPAHVLF
ncbi:hypothetical protein E2C06_25980 [Dankookia rubra]|uniref:Excalibur calcium-binding domain-containing protein n=1 Tax=Dankookia rubra TaxID=1442381 RepID=A0A4V3A9L2_9PROT|nr:hypothetical protein [Dankookia rubra]TDH59675.1 hypothetical protein E2C06_25980 [Dankookia rubra]